MINRDSLKNSGYIWHSDRNVGLRTIYRYELADSTSLDAVTRAAQAILELTINNPNLCPIFEVAALENFLQVVKERPYLVINGNAICLSSEPKAPNDVPPTAWDRLFSETLLKEPIRCEKNHSLERISAIYWKAKFGDICPGTGAPHGIGTMEIDEELQEDVDRYRESQHVQFDQTQESKQSAKIFETLAEQCKKSDELAERLLNQETKTLMFENSIRPTRTGELVGFGAKVAVKVPTVLLKSGIVVAKESAKMFLKKIPIISFFVGLCLGAYRIWQDRQYGRALGEVTSGALSAFFPGIGTAISFGIDGVLLGIDIHEVTLKDVQISPESAHRLLGLDPGVPQTRETIRRRYFAICRKLHPDTLSEVGVEPGKNQCVELQEKVNEARDILIKHYNFSEEFTPIDDAHDLLDLDSTTAITKEMIDNAYLTLLETVHENSMIPFGVGLIQEMSSEGNGWQGILDNAKATLMNHYKFA